MVWPAYFLRERPRAKGSFTAVELLAQVTVVVVPIVLENHRSHDFRRFEQAVEKIPEIVECWAVGGGVDYVLRFAMRTIDDYQGLIDRLLQADLGIQRYWSYVVTKSIKPFAGLPISNFLTGDPQKD